MNFGWRFVGIPQSSVISPEFATRRVRISNLFKDLPGWLKDYPRQTVDKQYGSTWQSTNIIILQSRTKDKVERVVVEEEGSGAGRWRDRGVAWVEGLAAFPSPAALSSRAC